MPCAVAGHLGHSPVLQPLKTKSSDHEAKGISELISDILVLLPFCDWKRNLFMSSFSSVCFLYFNLKYCLSQLKTSSSTIKEEEEEIVLSPKQYFFQFSCRLEE